MKTIALAEETHRKIKVFAASQGLTLDDAVLALLNFQERWRERK